MVSMLMTGVIPNYTNSDLALTLVSGLQSDDHLITSDQ